MSRRTGLILAGLVALQLVLLLGVFLPSPHPGGDNAGYVALGHALLSGEGYTELWDPARPPHTKYPPVFPALLAAAMALGASGWASLKVVPVAAGLVTVAAVFLWARRRLGLRAGAATALLTGLSPALLYHGHWLLSDVPFLAFVMLALWLLDETPDAPAPPPARSRLAAGLVFVILACLTRTAGLPLALAVLAAWLLAGHRRRAGVAGGALALPLGAWFVRGRLVGPGEGRYGSEFFLLDPYQPDLGPAGPGDFVARAGENLIGYLGRYIPEAMVGQGGGWAALLTGVLVILAAVGWWARTRRRPGPAELFLPLYTAVILVWPAVWSGDRFALPLVPLLLAFAAAGLARLLEGGRRTRWAPAAGATLAVLVGLGAGVDWLESRQEAARCRGALEAAGPWACGGGALVDFVATARWAGDNLPGESAALTRKPRIWYVMSGVPTRTYPFSEAPGVLLDEAGDAGARFVVLDFVGGQGARFVGAALLDRPDRFCQVGAFGGGQGVPATRLLRIGPPGEDQGTRVVDGQLALAPCREEGSVALSRAGVADGDWEIPLLR